MNAARFVTGLLVVLLLLLVWAAMVAIGQIPGPAEWSVR